MFRQKGEGRGEPDQGPVMLQSPWRHLAFFTHLGFVTRSSLSRFFFLSAVRLRLLLLLGFSPLPLYLFLLFIASPIFPSVIFSSSLESPPFPHPLSPLKLIEGEQINTQQTCCEKM